MRRGLARAQDHTMTNNDSGKVMAVRATRHLLRWMQVVGIFYLVQFVMMVFVRAPIRTFGPEGALAEANAGDRLAEFLVDTWTTFGLEVGAVGVVLLMATPGTLSGSPSTPW
jgi:hypothetical protein